MSMQLTDLQPAQPGLLMVPPTHLSHSAGSEGEKCCTFSTVKLALVVIPEKKRVADILVICYCPQLALLQSNQRHNHAGTLQVFKKETYKKICRYTRNFRGIIIFADTFTHE